MKVLLDENFPLRLLRRLRADGYIADHVITLGWRGASDTRIRERLRDDGLLFLTQDEDFLFGERVGACVVVSRVRQSRRIEERVEVWLTAVRQLSLTTWVEKLYELTDSGLLLPWQGVRAKM